MVVFPNIKINLGLNILSKREDGLHNISSVFYPVPLQEPLEIIPSTEFSFNTSGLPIPGDTENNLIIKAYQLLKKEFDLPSISIHLHKIIPMGGGLGGGSADGAFTIKALNELFSLGLNSAQMQALAKQLGSDCPFFIENKPILATETGTTFSKINIDLSNKYLILSCPQVHVSTATAYSKVMPKEPEISVQEIIENKPINEWKTLLQNDFELSVFPQFPEIKSLKDKFYHAGATYASMSGSGASVYGIFENKPDTNTISDIIWEGYL